MMMALRAVGLSSFFAAVGDGDAGAGVSDGGDGLCDEDDVIAGGSGLGAGDGDGDGDGFGGGPIDDDPPRLADGQPAFF